jgi:hypothetical protein
MRFNISHITAEAAEQEPAADRIFGPSYEARQRQLEAARLARIARPVTLDLIAAPGVKRPAARWPDASKLRGKRVSVDLEIVESTYRELVGDMCLSRPGVVKQVMNGYGRVAWGATQAWINIEALQLV